MADGDEPHGFRALLANFTRDCAGAVARASRKGIARTIPVILPVPRRFANWTKTRILADPQHETQILNSSARFLGVAPTEFATLEAVTVETTARLRTVHTEARAFIAASSKTSATIDHTALAAFENRRRVIVQDGVDQIRRSLSTKSWQGLLGYINDRHRLHVTVSPPGSNE
jgi:hypothetical protein